MAIRSGGHITPSLNPPLWQEQGMFGLEYNNSFIPVTAGDDKQRRRDVLFISLGSLLSDALHRGRGDQPARGMSRGSGLTRYREGLMEQLRQAFVSEARQELAYSDATYTINQAVGVFRQRVNAFFRGN